MSLPSNIVCSGEQFIPRLADLIRTLESGGQSSQFYVWSSGEHALLQTHIINAALTSAASDSDVRLCIGALAQGASLLQTAFQPLLLSGALMSFLGKGRRRKADYQRCLGRMGLPTDGTVEVLSRRLDAEIRKLQEDASSSGNEDRRKEFGQLPRVVILKREIERQLALPIPGYWDLPEIITTLVDAKAECASDEVIFSAYRKSEEGEGIDDLLARRNGFMYAALKAVHARAISAAGHSLFVNEANILTTKFMDFCKQTHLRKLFFMQQVSLSFQYFLASVITVSLQFEVLAKLTELWQSRIDSCPEAPTLEYCGVIQAVGGQQHTFRVLSGAVDVPSTDKDRAFYDKLLVLDTADSLTDEDGSDHLPVEALFDDLGVSGLVFPLNRYTKANWERQDPRIQRELCVADLRNVYMDSRGRGTMVAMRTWGTSPIPFTIGATYRLSPRLVDFNTTKVLSSLFELDLQWESERELQTDEEKEMSPHSFVPFVQLILEPNSLGQIPASKLYVKTENEMQRLFRNLKELGNDTAGSLALKASQHRATQRILTNRLSVIWGPPGIPFSFWGIEKLC